MPPVTKRVDGLSMAPFTVWPTTNVDGAVLEEANGTRYVEGATKGLLQLKHFKSSA